MAALRILGILLLVVLAMVLGVLALGAFASLNYAAPLWLRTLSLPEGVISARLGIGNLDTWLRALCLMGGSAALVFVAASWPPVTKRSATPK